MTSWAGSLTLAKKKKNGQRNTRDQDEQADRRGCNCLSEGRSAQSEGCLRGKLGCGKLFPYMKWAASAPEATHWLCGFLGNNHPQECRACPSVVGGALPRCFRASAALMFPCQRSRCQRLLSFNPSNFTLMPFYPLLNNTEFMSCALFPLVAWI